VDKQVTLTQSLAIIEYLDEIYPLPSLLPKDPILKGHARQFSLVIACDIHPIDNLRVLRYLQNEMGVPEEDKNRWYRHWVEQGLASVERVLAHDTRVGQFCFGDAPGLADCLLIPQVANGQRMNCNLSAMPTILRINEACMKLAAFVDASPAHQPDAE